MLHAMTASCGENGERLRKGRTNSAVDEEERHIDAAEMASGALPDVFPNRSCSICRGDAARGG